MISWPLRLLAMYLFSQQKSYDGNLYLLEAQIFTNTAGTLMSKKALTGFCLALGIIANIHADTIPAGTTIPVRTNTSIDARDTGNGRVYSGVVAQDVLAENDKVSIPRVPTLN